MRKLDDREYRVGRSNGYSRHGTATLHIGDDIEAELDFNPTDSYKDDAVQVYLSDDGKKIVVGYLVHDEDCENPMTSCDGNGRLIHSERNYDGYEPGTIADELGWDRDNECPDSDQYIVIDGVTSDLWTLACRMVAEDLEKDKQGTLETYCGSDFDELLGDAGGDVDALFDWLVDEIAMGLRDPGGTPWFDEIREALHKLYRAHWRQIVSPFVVEASYSPDRYSATAFACLFRGDAEDVSALWLADSNEEENIVHGMPEFTNELELDEALRHKAMEYAESTFTEFNAWAEGDCYGCVVQVFERQEDGSYESVDDESCWSFIGIEYAIEALTNDYVKPTLDKHDTQASLTL